ncbi:MAG: universal stress protein [Desulfobacteraceae bacterium]|nr:universal stress protein [Desulfobacteraceae bacterium]
MKEIGKILFPVDLSEVSPKIAPSVLDFAERFGAEIHLLFVARNLDYLSSVYVPVVSISNLEVEIIKGAEAKIEEFSGSYFKGYRACKTRVVVGDAAEEILKYAETEKIDLIIIGTHGRKGIDRILFGSVAEKVIKMSSVPVLSINPYRVWAAS